MEDPKAILWLCMIVAAFLSGKLLGYASRKHDEQEEQNSDYLKNLLCAATYSIRLLRGTGLRSCGQQLWLLQRQCHYM